MTVIANIQSINMNRVSDAVFTMRPLIEKSLKHSGNGWTFQDVADAIMSMKMHFWVNEGAFAVTEIINYPQYAIIHVFLAGGRMDKIYELEEKVAAFGREIGCKRMTFLGRKGWFRRPPIKWKFLQVLMVRDIGE